MRNVVADDLGGLRPHNGTDSRANFVHRAAGGFRDGGKVFVDCLRAADLGAAFLLAALRFGPDCFEAVCFVRPLRRVAAARFPAFAFFIGR